MEIFWGVLSRKYDVFPSLAIYGDKSPVRDKSSLILLWQLTSGLSSLAHAVIPSLVSFDSLLSRVWIVLDFTWNDDIQYETTSHQNRQWQEQVTCTCLTDVLWFVMPVCEVCMSWVGGGEVMKVHKPILNEIYTLQCTCSICHNTLFRTEMCTFLSVLNSVLWDLRIWSITLISPCVNFCNHTIPTPAPTPPTPQNTNMCMICGTWNA